MVSKGTLYGVVAVLLAASLLASSIALLYYTQYQQQTSETQRYVGELNAALGQYDSLSSSYQSALRGYNRTISLLSEALSNLNTSSPAYLDGSRALASLWRSYLDLTGKKASSITYSVNLRLDFGNGTKRWYNGTAIQPGWNAYIVTLLAMNGKVQATWYPSYGEHFVTAIGGVQNNPRASQGWLLWTWNSTARWKQTSVGPDLLPMYNGSVFAWTFCAYDPNTYVPLCSP